MAEERGPWRTDALNYRMRKTGFNNAPGG